MRTYRIQGCGAMFRARCELPSDRPAPSCGQHRDPTLGENAACVIGLDNQRPIQACPGAGRGAETVTFQTKPEIALEQIKAVQAAGLPAGVVLMDAGYGNDTGSPGSACATWRASVLTPRSGRRDGPSPRNAVGVADDHPSCCGVTTSTSRSPPRRSLSACRQRLGRLLPGARAAPTGLLRASHGRG